MREPEAVIVPVLVPVKVEDTVRVDETEGVAVFDKVREVVLEIERELVAVSVLVALNELERVFVAVSVQVSEKEAVLVALIGRVIVLVFVRVRV